MAIELPQAPLADWLVAHGLVTPDQLRTRPGGDALDAWLIRQQLVAFDDVLRGLSEVYGLPAVRLAEEEVDATLLSLLPADMVRDFRVLPIRRVDPSTVRVAMADPADVMAEEFLCQSLGTPALEKVVVSSWDIALYFERIDAATREISVVHDDETREMSISFTEEELASLTRVNEGDDAQQEDPGRLGPAIRVVTSLLSEAVSQRASDIHFEPVETGLRVRFRIDGHLREITELPQVIQSMILSRLKLSASLDISERRRPQDGRTRMQIGEKVVDFRVSTLPTYFGEKIVMRILDSSKGTIQIGNLGFAEDDLAALLELVHKPLGMILITGPTGSGKTTTLYACLTDIHNPRTNIVTVEDPVEYQIFGINQVAVNPKSGLTFSSALRSILRQDPDVVMIGEIRDLETACIAFEAAMTGHLVLSTLHTNDAPSAVTRLIHLGVPKYLVASSLLGVLAQRLVRRICSTCRTEVTLDDEQRDILLRSNLRSLPERFYAGSGCAQCFGSGYAGRTGLYEMLRVTSALKTLIYSDASDRHVRELARSQGMRTLLEDGMLRVAAGDVTVEEVLSVAPAGNEAAQAPSASPTPSASATPLLRHDDVKPKEEPPFPVEAGRVMLVCHDPSEAWIMQDGLTRAGFQVSVADGARDAFAQLLATPPDLLLADVDLRDIDGLALCRKIRANEGTASLPIIMLTPLGDPQSEGAALEAGADDCLTRPLDAARLYLRIEALLRRLRAP